MKTLQGKFSHAITTFNAWLHALLPVTDLVTRIYIANAFLVSGWSKISDWETTLFLFREEYQVPLLNPQVAAILATSGELVLPLLLVIGIFTQLSALGLFALNIVAVLSYYAALSQSPAALNDHLQWGIILAVLMAMPVHKLSLDYLLTRGRAIKPDDKPATAFQ